MSTPRFLLSALTVSTWTLLSRIAGFIRDLLLAAYLGSGFMGEAFQAAFALPNLFRRFFAEGAFNLAFVPIYTKKIDDPDAAADFAGEALSTLTGILLILILLAQLFMPALIYAVASGFADDERFILTQNLAYITFPYVLFISLAAVVGGILNAHRRFAMTSAAPILLNIILVLFLLVADAFSFDFGFALAWGVFSAGIAQLLAVWFALLRLGIQIHWRLPRFSPQIRQLLIVALPALLTGGVIQINLLVGRQIASFTEGAYVWLYMADRLYQLPLGVVGIAIGVVLLPELSKQLAAKDTRAGQVAFNRAVEFCAFLALPSAVALMLIPYELSSVLFERGAYSAGDVRMTAAALAVYGLGLPAFVLQKAYQPLFFAREDTKTPFYFALVSLVVNAVVALALVQPFGYIAAAIGTTTSAWAMLALLIWRAHFLGHCAYLEKTTLTRIFRIVICSVIMGVLILILADMLQIALHSDGIRYLALAGLISAGIICYFASCAVLQAIRLRDLRTYLRR